MTTAQYVRVINSQKTFGNSVLLDKIDRTSGQFETDLGYAQTAKQPVYVPYRNPVDPTVPGYIDLVPTDEVLLQLNQPHGVINKLSAKGIISYVLHHSSAIATPTVSGGVHTDPGAAAPSGSHLSISAAVVGTNPATETGSNASPFNSSAANANKLNIRASSTAVFSQVVTTPLGSAQTAAQVVADLNTGFAAASLPFIASANASGHVIITSTITGPTSYIEFSTSSPSAGTLSTVLGLSAGPIFPVATAQVVDSTAAAWSTSDVGKDIIIPGGGGSTHPATPANIGTFKIVDFVSTTTIEIANAAAVSDANNGTIIWTEATEGNVTITGTTFTSLTPDHTYVILTNLSGVSQTISDTAIIAAGPPNVFSNTSIVIDYALITIGTPAVGWKIVIQANSKKSASFTMT